jgi:hypothetical protein
LKASWLAFASLVSIGSAQAGEIAAPPLAAKIGETAISRMYRVAWLANFGRQREELRGAPAPLRTEIRTIPYAQETMHAAALEGAAQAQAVVDARIKEIAARVDDEMHTIAAGKPLRYKLRVDCSTKYVEALRPPKGPAPAVLTAFGSDVTSVKVSVESCTVKVLWKFLDGEPDAPQMRAYSVSVPIEQTAD